MTFLSRDYFIITTETNNESYSEWLTHWNDWSSLSNVFTCFISMGKKFFVENFSWTDSQYR
jgi:hypothetical protein